MFEIQELAGGRLASRLLNVEAIQEVAGERERTHILMSDGTQHVVEISDRAFRSRLALVQADWQEEQIARFRAGVRRGRCPRLPIPSRASQAALRVRSPISPTNWWPQHDSQGLGRAGRANRKGVYRRMAGGTGPGLIYSAGYLRCPRILTS